MNLREGGALGEWHLEPPDESVGIFGWAVSHEGGDGGEAGECITAPGSVEVGPDRITAECSCGAVLHVEREQ